MFYRLILGLWLLFIVACQSPEQVSSVTNQVPLPPGYNLIQGEGVSIALPSSYIGGNPHLDLGFIKQQVIKINPNFRKRLELIEPMLAPISLLAINLKDASLLTNLNITYQKFPKDSDPEANLTSLTNSISLQGNIKSQKNITINQQSITQLIVEYPRSQQNIKQLFYLIPQDHIWRIAIYTTTEEQFNQLLPEFESSIISFKDNTNTP